MRKLNDINTSPIQSLDLLNGKCCNGKVVHACRCLHAVFSQARRLAECSNPAVTAGKAAPRKGLLPQMVLTQRTACMLIL